MTGAVSILISTRIRQMTQLFEALRRRFSYDNQHLKLI
jgi:hypothetical protein